MPKREKSEQQRIKEGLLRVVYTEESENQLKGRLEKSWWEKLGFQDKKKEERNLREAKEKTDVVFKQLRETMQRSLELQRRTEESRQMIKSQQIRKEVLKETLQKKALELQEQDIIIAKALEDQRTQVEQNRFLLEAKRVELD